MNAIKSNQYGAMVHEIGTLTGEAKARADRRLAASYRQESVDGAAADGAPRDIHELGHGATLEFVTWGKGWTKP